MRGVAAQLYVHAYGVEVNDGDLKSSNANDETFFASVLMMYKIPFAFMPPKFYIFCSGVQSVTFRDTAATRDGGGVTENEWWPQCPAAAYLDRQNLACVRGNYAGPLKHVRYEKEYDIALSSAECLEVHRLTSAAGRVASCAIICATGSAIFEQRAM